MTYRCIVFDFFGVICAEVAPFWLARYLSQSEAALIKQTLVGAADRGEISQEHLFDALASRTHIEVARIEQEWKQLAHIDVQLIGYIESLRPQYKIGLLTNSPSPFVRDLLAQHDLSRLFETIVVSSEIGCAKPEQQAYWAILRGLSAQPLDAIMIDDNPVNVAGAVGVGMQGLLYRSFSELATTHLETAFKNPDSAG